MKLKIYYANEQKIVKIPLSLRSLINRVVKATLENENFKKDAEVSVSFVNNETIHKLNLEYRGKDKPTDVLSFPMTDGDEEEDDIDLSTGAVMLSNIKKTTERAMEQANEYGHGIEREICFLAVHSTLHLLGYDHETSEDDEKYMNQTQETILQKIGLTR